MSDTPRTDSMEPYLPPYNDSALIHVPATFARQLERQLNSAQGEVTRLRKALEFIASDVRCCSLDVATKAAREALE